MPHTITYADGAVLTVQTLTVSLLFDDNNGWHTDAAGTLKIVDKIEAELTATQTFEINAWPKPPATSTWLDIASAMSRTTTPGSGSARWVATNRPVGATTENGQKVTLGPSKATGVDVDWTFDSDNPPMKLKVVIRQP